MNFYFSDINFSDINFSDINFSDVNFLDINFSGINILDLKNLLGLFSDSNFEIPASVVVNLCGTQGLCDRGIVKVKLFSNLYR